MILKSFYVNKKYLNRIADWRNAEGMEYILRSKGKTIKKNQVRWCKEVIKSKADKYFYIIVKGRLVGYCALTNINVIQAEISLLVGEAGKHYGRRAVNGLLEYAFTVLKLKRIWGEVYNCNPNKDFWYKVGFLKVSKLNGTKEINGVLYSSEIFDYDKKKWLENGY